MLAFLIKDCLYQRKQAAVSKPWVIDCGKNEFIAEIAEQEQNHQDYAYLIEHACFLSSFLVGEEPAVQNKDHRYKNELRKDPVNQLDDIGQVHHKGVLLIISKCTDLDCLTAQLELFYTFSIRTRKEKCNLQIKKSVAAINTSLIF